MRTASVNRRSIKEALDNLPSGLCFFDRRDILVLCNRQMYRLFFALTGRELQTRFELDSAIAASPESSPIPQEGELYLFPDGTVWKFSCREVSDSAKTIYTEYVASEVTELYMRQKELEKGNREQRALMARLEQVARNVVSITREEEILALKMQIHNDLGYCLQATRQFLLNDCPPEQKASYAAEQKKMAYTLLGEVGNEDAVDVYSELQRIAAKLDMKITTQGAIPQSREPRELLALAIRESLTNTIRHAGGDQVYVNLKNADNTLVVTITNNGTPPACEVSEGGGLRSLRDKVEKSGGQMQLISLPKFKMTLHLPLGEKAL